jgi:uncharacterized caspase-like protein
MLLGGRVNRATRRSLGAATVALFAVAVSASDGQRQLERVGRASRAVALCVGNDAYPTMPLQNAVNDARAVCGAVARLGFTVDVQRDLGGEALDRAVDAFVGRLGSADVGLFFYAGHGLQIDGENFLVPADFRADDEIAAKYRCYRMDQLRERMERSGTRINLIVLDACRDNPFRFKRSGSRGLSAMQPGRGTLIAMATGPGQTASDAPGSSNGLFTTHLLRALAEPGLSIEQVFKRTREAVSEASGQKQRPWLMADLTGEFYLHPPGAAGARVDAPPPVASASNAAELALWAAVAGSSDPRDLEEYLGRYPAGEFAGVARNRLERLRPPRDPLPDLPRVVPAGGPVWPGGVQPPAKERAQAQERLNAQREEAACSGGSSWDCVALAQRYANGLGVVADGPRATALLDRACAASAPSGAGDADPLKLDEGTWDARVETFVQPGAAPTVTRATERNTFACGGRWLVTNFEGTVMGMAFRGNGIAGWDAGRRTYANLWVDSMSPGPSRGTATFDAASRTWTVWMEAIDSSGEPMRGKAVARYEGQTRLYSLYMVGADGREVLTMRTTYTRR